MNLDFVNLGIVIILIILFIFGVFLIIVYEINIVNILRVLIIWFKKVNCFIYFKGNLLIFDTLVVSIFYIIFDINIWRFYIKLININ